ncbi:DUF6538 domain-containing protein [Rubrimonas cliftonensis]|uniref:DUF6538 domain-containing protein n=1 Tax=Rubrimonas cliftonensis TaxID=89524 RepID=UPI003183BB40
MGRVSRWSDRLSHNLRHRAPAARLRLPTHRPCCGERPTLHLTRRGGVWRHRRRTPEQLRALGLRSVRAISLRTDRLPEAMVRAQGLDRVLEAAWKRIAMAMTTIRRSTCARRREGERCPA